MCAHKDTCGRESRNTVSFTWFRIPEIRQESSESRTQRNAAYLPFLQQVAVLPDPPHPLPFFL